MGLKKLDSEYKSNYKSIPVHRPVMVKAKSVSQPLDNAPEALESSRRAGLLSNQIGSVSEPPLQRRKIVPYQHNHNIFETRTVKELDDQQWMEAVGSDVESQRNTHHKTTKPEKVKTNKKDTEYSSHYLKDAEKTESPLITAEKKSKTFKKDKHQKPAIMSQDISPERLPPAGRPTYISDPHDKRLLRPSDSSAYLTFPDYDIPKRTCTEYSERYENTTPGNKNKSNQEIKPEQTSFIDADTYRKVIEQRNHAYGISPSKTALLQKTQTITEMKRDEYNKRYPRISEDDVKSSRSSTSSRRSHKDERKIIKQHDEKPAIKTKSLNEQNTEKDITALKKSRTKKRKEEHEGVNRHREEQTFSKRTNGKRTPRAKSTHLSRASDDVTPRQRLERGRSPTPELRQAGQSRRHHLDVTTGISNPLASSVDQYKTQVLKKITNLDIHERRPDYDPSCYSDAGDTASSISSWTHRSSVDSRSVATTTRSSKRSF